MHFQPTLMMRSILFMAIALFASATQAKCPPGQVNIQLKQANGELLSFMPDSTTYPYYGPLAHYGQVALAPGDTLMVTMGYGSCGASNTVTRAGAFLAPSNSPGWGAVSLFKCVVPGSYEAMSCDEGCNALRFDLVPAGSTGTVTLSPRVLLDGAAASATPWHMSAALRDAGLLPQTEPYTAMGYVHRGGGGGEVRASVPPFPRPLVDWVLVELRHAAHPEQIVASKSALLATDGTVIDAATYAMPRFNVPPGYYYVAVRHRNHLGTMTAAPVRLMDAAVLVNFSHPSGPALYGTEPVRLRDGYRLLWCGNSKSFGMGHQQIKYIGPDNDRDAILGRLGGSVPTAMVNGYFTEDVNLDGKVKYIGTGNDRDLVLGTVGGSVPTAVRNEQLP